MELPEGWSLGRVTRHAAKNQSVVTLFYKGAWVEKFVVDETLEDKVRDVLANPTSRIYPSLYKDGLLDFTHHKCDKGIWNLIDQGLITPEEGYTILPTSNFIRTAKRKGVWKEAWKEKSNYAHHEGRTYALRSGSWYDITDKPVPLPKKKVFRSIWDARVQYGNGRCTIADVAEYNLSAVLECAGDLMSFTPTEGNRVFNQIMDALEKAASKPLLRGFVKHGIWEPVYSFSKKVNNVVWNTFQRLLRDVCMLNRSGYEAHLKFVNGYDLTVKLEHERFKKAKRIWKRKGSGARFIHIPFLRHLDEKLEAMSLTECRDFLQKSYAELFSIGPYTKKNRLVFFNHKGYSYGLWVNSGKIFRTLYDTRCFAVPFGFDKKPEEERRSLLGSAFDYLDAEWCAKARRARRGYYFYTRVQKKSALKARYLVTKKHLKTNIGEASWKIFIDKVSCSEVNKTAVPITINWKTERRVA